MFLRYITFTKKIVFALLFLIFVVFSTTSKAASGDFDPSFGIGGKVVSPLGKISNDHSFASALQADGKIIVAGDSISDRNQDYFQPNTSHSLFVARINADGSLDASFGTNGKVIMLIPGTIPTVVSVVVQPDGKIIAGCLGMIDNDVVASSFLLVRYNSNGSIDNSFGTNGVVKTTFGTANNTLTSVALQSNGKIVASGYISSDGQTPVISAAVARYNTNGSLDTSFDGDGKLSVRIGNNDTRSAAMAIRPNDKIVLGGYLGIGSSVKNFALIQLNADGSLDTSFDGDGTLTTAIGAAALQITALKIQTDGKIVAAGRIQNFTESGVIVARYNTDGSLDSTFDTDGIVITDTTDEYATALGIQPDGKIIVGGYKFPGSTFSYSFLSIRYNADGSLDTSYNGTGKIITTIPSSNGYTTGILIQPNGKILLTGYISFSSDSNIALVRYNSNGTLDASFDGDGIASIELGNSTDAVDKIALQSDGKIIAAGHSFDGFNRNVTVARYNPDGSLDASFGVQGVMVTDLNITASVSNVAVQPDGKIVVGVNNYENVGYRIIRYNSDGSLDNSFGSEGISTVEVGTVFDYETDLALQSNGKIVISGYSFDNSGQETAFLIRLNADGSLDANFGTGGKVLVNTPASSSLIDSIKIQSDGKIVVAGSNFIYRYKSNGSPDTNFGSGGTIDTSSIFEGNIPLLEIQSNGKIVAAGTNFDSNYVFARFNTNGSLDVSFDGDGKVLIAAQPDTFNTILDLVIQQNGKILATGDIRGSTGVDAVLLRLNTNGLLDNNFGSGGKIIVQIGSGDNGFGSLLFQPDGKLVAGGYSSNGANFDFTLARFEADAQLAPSRVKFDFDGDGRADVSVFRPNGGFWYLLNSSSGFSARQFGGANDKLVPADYDGDGITDLAVYRGGTWYLQRSSDGFVGVAFGEAADVPQPADYDGDGRAEIAVYRPSNGSWYILNLINDQFSAVQFGEPTDKPVAADYDGDGKADVAVFRPENGTWYLQGSLTGFTGIQFGDAGDNLVPADYDGDGKADLAVFRPSNGTWYLQRSKYGFTGIQFGTSSDKPVPADYDGDGATDLAVFHNGMWLLRRSSSGLTNVVFGESTDNPVPNAYVQ